MVNLAQNKYDLVPKKGVGPVTFGESRDQIRVDLGEPDFVQAFSPNEIKEHYDSLSLLVMYGSDSTCNGVEVPRGPALMLEGVNLFEMSWPEFLQWIEARDPDVEDIEDGYTFLSLRLGVAAGPKRDEPDVTESIFVFGDSYRWQTAAEQELASLERVSKIPPTPKEVLEGSLEDWFEYVMSDVNETT